jgi:molecular chaperone GrpE (heat shock protein)
VNEEGFANLAIELWKLIRSFEQALEMLPLDKQSKVKAQVRFSYSRLVSLLDDAGVRIKCFDGEPFEPNLPVTAVNADDFNGVTENLVVKQTIEPAVVKETKVLVFGKVVLARGG